MTRMAQPQAITGASTDADGFYKLDGVAEGDRLIQFNKSGYIPAQKPVDVKAGDDVKLDVELDPGKELRGRVVDRSGRGVAGAYIQTSAPGEQRGNGLVATDADGSFVVAGLSDGRYRVSARKEGMVSADATDVDVPQARPLTLTLESGATINGRVSGLPPDQLAQVTVAANGGTSRTQTNADGGGNFTLTGVPDGQVRVEAFLLSGGRRRLAPPKTIVVENGVAPAVELNFEEGITVSGRVTKGGVPLQFGSITFMPILGAAGNPRPGVSGGVAGVGPQDPARQFVNAAISSDGTYSAAGLGSCDYTVFVTGSGISRYQTRYTATVSGTFDIDMRGAALRGRVVDSRSGAPLAGARVIVNSQAPSNGFATTDSDGRFVIETLPDATYDLRVDRDEYAATSQQIVVANGSAPEVEVRMEKSSPTTIRVTDAATGAPIDGNVVIRDASGGTARVEPTRIDTGTFRAWLKAGSYSAVASARGYVFKTQSFTTPGDVTIALPRGGTLMVRAHTAQRARLDLAGGGQQRFLGLLHPGDNGPYESLPAGSYMLSLIGSDGKVVQSIAVVINAGQTTTIDTP